MTEIKVNLSVVLQGRTMFSKEECLKTTQKVIEKTSKKTGKTYKKKVNVLVNDLDKMDKHTLRVTEHYADKKPVTETITFHTRKSKPATQSLNICKEGYNYMISGECPFWAKTKVWAIMSETQRLEAHLQRVCEHVGGKSFTYEVLGD